MTGGPRPAAGATGAERRLVVVLRAVAGALLALTVAGIVAAEIGDGLKQPPWIGTAVGTGALAVLVALYAAGEPRRRAGLVGVLLLMLGVAAVAQLVYAIAGEDDAVALLTVAAVELALAAAVALAARAAHRPDPPPPGGYWPSAADKGLRPVLLARCSPPTPPPVRPAPPRWPSTRRPASASGFRWPDCPRSR
jgi:hypothetical protein